MGITYSDFVPANSSALGEIGDSSYFCRHDSGPHRVIPEANTQTESNEPEVKPWVIFGSSGRYIDQTSHIRELASWLSQNPNAVDVFNTLTSAARISSYQLLPILDALLKSPNRLVREGALRALLSYMDTYKSEKGLDMLQRIAKSDPSLPIRQLAASSFENFA